MTVHGTSQLRELVERTSPVSLAVNQVLPVLGALEPLFPSRGLARGSVVEVGGAAGATTVALSLMAGASRTGSWVACVGFPQLGWEAAEEQGVDPNRLVAVSAPGREWPNVVAALIDAFDLVLCGPEVAPTATQLRRLRARARERGAVVMAVNGRCTRQPSRSSGRGGGPMGAKSGWPSADVRLEVRRNRWDGPGQGWGALDARCLEVRLEGRAGLNRPRTVELVIDGSGRLQALHEKAGMKAPASAPACSLPAGPVAEQASLRDPSQVPVSIESSLEEAG